MIGPASQEDSALVEAAGIFYMLQACMQGNFRAR